MLLRRARVAALLWLLLAALLGCHRAPEAAHVEEAPTVRRQGNRLVVPEGSPLLARLEVAALAAQPVRRTLETPAEVQADPARMARVTPPLQGRVVDLRVHFGETVTQGQALLTMDSPDLVAAQTDYLRARSALAQADRTLARQRDLASHGVTAQREVEQAATDRDLAAGELRRAELRLHLLGIDAGSLGRPLTVRAPISGRIVEFQVAPGEYRSDQAQSMMTIADLSTVWVTAQVQEKDMGRVHVGQDVTASFVAYPGASRAGQVLYVGDLLNHDTRTIQVRVSFANADGALRPGMFSTTVFSQTAEPELVLPATAVLLLGDANYAFVEVGPRTYERRRVTVSSAQDPEHVVVGSELRVGERIVVRNAVLLQ